MLDLIFSRPGLCGTARACLNPYFTGTTTASDSILGYMAARFHHLLRKLYASNSASDWRFSIQNSIFLWNQNQQIFLTISAVILIFTLLLGVLYRRNAKRIRAALENMQLQHQIEQNQLYIELLSQKYHTLRQYQHDFKKHLAYIQQLAQQNDMAAIDTYIRNVYADLQSGTALKLTGNQTLDILLSDKIQQAKMQKIAFQLDYQPGVQITHIAAPDFCILLGNLLDNALAATEQSTQKQITCTIQQKNSYYMAIHVINSCDTLPVMKDGIPQRKQPSEQHGYGVQNVLNCAKKYGGHCQFTYCSDQKQFQATVLLPCAELDENR